MPHFWYLGGCAGTGPETIGIETIRIAGWAKRNATAI
jgi:hypothetical protein